MIIIKLTKEREKLLWRELERSIHPPVPTTVLTTLLKAVTGLGHLETMGCFHSANICGSTMGSMETLREEFKGQLLKVQKS